MIERQVNKILASLDGLQRAPADPYLYQKVIGRLEQDRAGRRVNPAWAWRLAAICLLLLGLNVLSWIRFHKTETAGTETSVQRLYSDYISNTSAYGY